MRKLIGKREPDLMKPQAYLIRHAAVSSTSRTDQGPADVYWNEPYWNDPPFTPDPAAPEEFCKLDNVILAPHNGNATWDIRGRKTASIAQGMVAMMRGERPTALLNPEIYGKA